MFYIIKVYYFWYVYNWQDVSKRKLYTIHWDGGSTQNYPLNRIFNSSKQVAHQIMPNQQSTWQHPKILPNFFTNINVSLVQKYLFELSFQRWLKTEPTHILINSVGSQLDRCNMLFVQHFSSVKHFNRCYREFNASVKVKIMLMSKSILRRSGRMPMLYFVSVRRIPTLWNSLVASI